MAGCALFARPGSGEDAPKPPALAPVRVQLIAFNDFHGNLEPPAGRDGRIPVPAPSGTGTVDVDAGGAIYLAHDIEQLRQQNPHTVVVSAGDLIGASPLVSGIFHDEPTIELMNLIGLDINGVGNHEFDDGREELLRMQNGGCHANGCEGSASFPGAKFKFLAANVFTDAARKQTLLPPYDIKEFEGVKIAFIGMTLEGTAGIVNPTGVQGLFFQDEADTVNALVPELKRQGVEAIVVVLHEGGLPPEGALYDQCPGISGPIVDITERLDDEVDVVISGHTHQAYNCVIDGKRVTSAASYGRILTDIDLVLDPVTQDVVETTARNIVVTRDTAQASVDQFVKDYVAKSLPLASRVIGYTSADLKLPPRPLPSGQGGDYSMGSVVADAMLEATRGPEKGGAVIAFQNPGGVRADILRGEITYGEAFSVQPFSNNVVTMTLTGAQIERALEQQFRGTTRLVMQVSAGFTYTWSESAPVGEKIDPASIKLHGKPLDPAANYRVTMSNFMATGGDGYKTFTEGKELLTGPIDLDVLEAYLRAHNPLTPPAQGRITVVP